MVIYCILWIFALYGFLNICLGIFFQYIYKDIDCIVRINNSNCLEFVIKSLRYNLWYIKKIRYISNIKDDSCCEIVKKFEKNYGIKIINKK